MVDQFACTLIIEMKFKIILMRFRICSFTTFIRKIIKFTTSLNRIKDTLVVVSDSFISFIREFVVLFAHYFLVFFSSALFSFVLPKWMLKRNRIVSSLTVRSSFSIRKQLHNVCVTTFSHYFCVDSAKKETTKYMETSLHSYEHYFHKI